ncbi:MULTISPECIES: hypothetical protein [Actinomadura]|uniref:Uncharacterized protein n=2 Tax=Actinomadura yumaensis TaxID=111807 RepID=A0ABW2CAF3_9ACTN|nr:hypothetical protein [Actinomadura sp. J1-007]MWK33569.1 hypothetical protein [Actinomadura sp. J1-007]
MVSKRHEGPIHIIRNNPEVIAHLLRDAFGLVLPEYTSVINGSEEFTQVAPASYRGDNVVLLCGKDPARPSLAVVAETQLKIDSDKPFTWPVYASVLRERKRCDVLLVVFCTRKSVAAWADTSIDLGHSRFQLRPLVIGPGTAPLVTTTGEAARRPELAILATLVGAAGEPDQASMEIVHAALATLNNAGHKDAVLYSEMVLDALPKAAQRILEALMTTGTTEFKSDFAKRHEARGKAEGKVEGEAKALLLVLAAHGIEISEEQREMVTGCQDTAVLEEWLKRVATAETIEDVLG